MQTQFGSGAAVSGAGSIPARPRARRARVGARSRVVAAANSPPGASILRPDVAASTSAAPGRALGEGRRAARRGDLNVARANLKPKGMTDAEWAQQLREANPNYRLFSERARDRIATRGPMIGDMRSKDALVTSSDVVGKDVPTVNLEMLGTHPDLIEPNWKEIPVMSTKRMVAEITARNVRKMEIWDPKERLPESKWPPKWFDSEVPPQRKYLLTLTNGTKHWVDSVNEELDAALIEHAEQNRTWYSYHMKPDVNKFSTIQYLGSAVGGFVFLTGSIYLGIMRKHSIPTDAIQAMEFAQSRADARKDAQVDVTLEDVGGLENIVEDLNEVIAFLKNPESFKRLGAKPPKGLLMEGGPGVGKTLIAKAIAGEAAVPFYSMSGAEFVEIIVGVGAARVRDLFKRARLNAPCLIFVDEIDALGTKRAAAGTRGTEEHEQTLNQLLTEMDGFTPDTGVVFIGATNRADLLDPALMRPGRFDRKVTVPQPGLEARAKILQIHLAKRNVDPNIDTMQFAKNLPGLSGAELANICNEAATISVRRGGEFIETCDVIDAVDRVTNGLKKPLMDKNNPVVHRLTRHELGHAIVATVLYRHNKLIEAVERVSIIPRGRDPTQTTYNRKADAEYMFPTRQRLLERVQVLLAGLAAEQVYFGTNITTMSKDDVRDANDLVRNVVVNYALGQPNAVTTYTYNPDSLFTPERTIQTRKSRVASTGEMNRHDYNRKIHGYGRDVDLDHYQYAERKMMQILNEALENAKAIVRAYQPAFDVAYEELLENDVMSGPRLEEILDANPPLTTDYPHRGPDTPCKILPSEAEEEKAGTRVIKNRAQKLKHAMDNYYTHTKLEPDNWKDRTKGLVVAKDGSLRDFDALELEDYMPELRRSKARGYRELGALGRDVPVEPYVVTAMKENLKDDSDWLKKEHTRVSREADRERKTELEEELIPTLEAKVIAAGANPADVKWKASDKVPGRLKGLEISEIKFVAKTLAAVNKIGPEGLTNDECRRLISWRDELDDIDRRLADPEWTPDPTTYGLPPLWAKDPLPSEAIAVKYAIGGAEESDMAWELISEMRESFARGGYVRCWDGKYHKESECHVVVTADTGPEGKWCEKGDEKRMDSARGLNLKKKYEWISNFKTNGF
jgi:ATP-dependent metalloprotease FtsH